MVGSSPLCLVKIVGVFWLLLLASTCPLSVCAQATFELYNADTDQKIVDLMNGTVVSMSGFAGMTSNSPSFNIEVRFASSLNVGSVKFGLDADLNVRTERKAPFALCGNQGRNFFSCDKLLSVGTHTVTATPYKPAQLSAAAPAGAAATVTFSIVSTKAPTSPTTPPTVGGPTSPMSSPASAPINANFCRRNLTCVDCLTFTVGCGWYSGRGGCMNSCNEIADVKCYDNRSNISESIDQSTPDQSRPAKVCAQANRDGIDANLCAPQKSCSACTGTLRTDQSPCFWLPVREGFCHYEKCNFLFGCGSQTCPVTSPVAPPMPVPPKALMARPPMPLPSP